MNYRIICPFISLSMINHLSHSSYSRWDVINSNTLFPCINDSSKNYRPYQALRRQLCVYLIPLMLMPEYSVRAKPTRCLLMPVLLYQQAMSHDVTMSFFLKMNISNGLFKEYVNIYLSWFEKFSMSKVHYLWCRNKNSAIVTRKMWIGQVHRKIQISAIQILYRIQDTVVNNRC